MLISWSVALFQQGAPWASSRGRVDQSTPSRCKAKREGRAAVLCGEEFEHILIVSYIVMSHIVFIYHHIVINSCFSEFLLFCLNKTKWHTVFQWCSMYFTLFHHQVSLEHGTPQKFLAAFAPWVGLREPRAATSASRTQHCAKGREQKSEFEHPKWGGFMKGKLKQPCSLS